MFSASGRNFDLNGEATMARPKQSSPSFRRLSQFKRVINSDEAFGIYPEFLAQNERSDRRTELMEAARLWLFSFSLAWPRFRRNLSSEEVTLQSWYDHEQHDGPDQHPAHDHRRERSLHLATDPSRERGR
jgi:hypothetical protein